MPDDGVSYKWNDSHIDILLENLDDDMTVREKNITGFFRGIGVVGLSSGNISRIISAGFNTVPKIISMTLDELMTVDGFQLKSATKIHNGIQEQIKNASLVSLMSASNMFGRGFSEKKIELIMEHYPSVLVSSETVTQKVETVASIKGMATKTAELFVDKIPDFIEFMKGANLLSKLELNLDLDLKENYVEYDTNNPLYKKTIVFTGYRDNVLKEKLAQLGAKIGTSVSKNTFIVLVKDANALADNTGKLLDAKNLGVTIMTHADFVKQFNNIQIKCKI
jgi:NAD-dependent DNA ligase